MDTGNISNNFAKIIKNEVLEGEKVLWSGPPDPSVIFSPGDLFNSGLGLVFTVLSLVGILINLGVIHSYAPGEAPSRIFSVVALPLLALGLYLLLFRYVVKHWRKKKTYYAVTSRRVIELYKGMSSSLSSIEIRQLLSVSIAVRSSGIGTIRFGASHPSASIVENAGLEPILKAAPYGGITFYDIRDAEQVYRLVEQAKAEAVVVQGR